MTSIGLRDCVAVIKD